MVPNASTTWMKSSFPSLWSSLGRTPVRTSNRHDNIRLNIMIVLLPDRRSIMINIMIVFLHGHCNIMITIMIVFLPHNVHVHTILKGKGYLPMHEHTIMVPTFFISLSFNTTPLAFWTYHIVFHIISHFVYLIFHAYFGLYFMLVRRFACQSYHIIQIT